MGDYERRCESCGEQRTECRCPPEPVPMIEGQESLDLDAEETRTEPAG